MRAWGRWRAFAVVLGVLVGLLAVTGGPPTQAGTTIDWLVYQPLAGPCIGGATHEVNSIHDAVTAANAAGAPATIVVCAGDYPEPNLVITQPGIALLGPGITPEDDGVATIELTINTGHMVEINAENVQVDGFAFNGTPPPNYNFGTTAILGSKGHATVSDNTFGDIANTAITFAAQALPDSVNILRNRITTPGNLGIYCGCTNSLIEDNIVDNPGGHEAVGASGEGITFNGNTVLGGEVYVRGDNATITDNVFDGQGSQNAYNVISGYGVVVSGNQFKNIDSQALVIGASQSMVASVTLTKNSFQASQSGIHIDDSDPTDQYFVNVTIGGSPANANVFSGIDGDLVFLTRVVSDIPAEYNNWGYCTAADIEAHITHHPDDSTLGTVDYEPFIDPGDCPTATPSPTPTPSGTPTPSPTPTLAPGQHKQGDLDCDGTVDAADALWPVRHAAGVPLAGDPGTCPPLTQGDPQFGDVTCDGTIGPADTIAILQFAASVAINPPQVGACTPIGEVLS